MMTRVRRDLPSGTVTFLFTDVEGSTKLLHELGADVYARVLAEHRRVLREAYDAHGGVEVDTQGDAFFVAFPTASGALRAAAEATGGLAAGPIRVRMGIHTGTPHLAEEGYVGVDVHRAARIAACGHGGQVLVSAATAALVGAEELRFLGEHRLKDLSAPEGVYQLGDADFPPLKSLHQTNLPIPSTPFLGREHELAEVLGLLSREDVRLLTLTGPGGTGKTRLGLQAAGGLADRYPQGVWWVALAPLHDSKLVSATAAHALGATDGLADHIGDGSMLVLFDNFEQVIDAAADLADVLASCPNLDVLVTSREPLHLTGEQEYPVPPLAHEEGVDLFAARARAVKPDFEPDDAVPAICRRLDDLPLALELAAARVRAVSPAQILERLDQRLPLLTGGARDLPERQRTLRATIEWSYELLAPEEQRLFARLAVFRGGCTLEAAEHVTEADLDGLESLVDKNLLRHREDRYWMLETIAEYAAERLRQGEEETAIRDRHLEHFLALAERAYVDRLSSPSSWFATMDAEHDNFRSALDWAAAGDPAVEAQLVGAIAPYWVLRGHALEARERLTAALARHEAPDVIRARALTELGEVVGVMGMDREALGHLDEARELWREHGDARGEALALEMMGYCYVGLGELPPARLAFEQSLALREAAGASDLEKAGSLSGLCQELVASGEIERAEPLAQELYELGARHGARRTEQSGLHYLADCPLIAGNYAESEERYIRALAHARRFGMLTMCTEELLGVAMSVAGQGDPERAVRLAAAAYTEKEALGTHGTTLFWKALQERFIGGARAQLPPEALEAAQRAGREQPFQAVLDEVLGVPTPTA
jgi:predicted ATPase/class 3 adenylate cyclase